MFILGLFKKATKFDFVKKSQKQSQYFLFPRLSSLLISADERIKKWKGTNKPASWITLNGTLNNSSFICFIFRRKYIHIGLGNILWSMQTSSFVKRKYQFMIAILSGNSTLQIARLVLATAYLRFFP